MEQAYGILKTIAMLENPKYTLAAPRSLQKEL